MGRHNILPGNSSQPCRLHLIRLRWQDGDYDAGGAYWGGGVIGDHIWWAKGDCGDIEVQVFVRAKKREQAKNLIRATLPNAKFYR